MTQEINQLARAKLARKHGLRAEYLSNIGSWWEAGDACSWLSCFEYRVHPDDNEDLDAIIWEGAPNWATVAVNQKDVAVCFAESFTDNARIYSPRTNGEWAICTKAWKLIATRELPADASPVVDEPPLIGECAGDTVTREDQLFADIKEFLLKYGKCFNSQAIQSRAEKLLDRINPKPVRCSSQLPVDTLCEVFSKAWDRNVKAYSDGKGGYFVDGLTSATAMAGTKPESNFKVLEQPHPTFWQGGECPVPDWVEVKVWLRKGKVITHTHASKLDWVKLDNPLNEIIAYQIMGEKND